MRTLHLASALTIALMGLLERPAAAQWGAPPRQPANIADGEVLSSSEPRTAPAAIDPAPMRDLQRQAFEHESVHFDGSRIMLGNVTLHVTTFYALAGRPDLSDLIRTRRTNKTVAISAGAAVMAMGFVWAVLDAAATDVGNALTRPLSCGSADTRPECADESHPSPFPWIMVAVGGAAMITGIAFPSDPLGRAEKEALISDYNQRLRARLGLSSALEAARRTARVGAVVAPGGQSGMLFAGCSF